MAENFKQAMFELFDQLKRNMVWLHYQPAAEALPLGSSRFGGQPDVPADFAWPYFAGKAYNDDEPVNRPLAFMAQINLAEAAEFDTAGLLPKQGMLSFFYELETEFWGFDPANKGCARVFWFKDAAALQRADFPADLAEDFQLPEFALTMEAKAALPDCITFMNLPETQAVPRQYPEEADKFDWDAYDELVAEYGCQPPEDDWSETSKLLGWANTIQGPVEYECEAVRRGVYNLAPQELSEEQKREIMAASRDWLLLFQMGTVEDGEDFELMFGDVGHIYFFIRKQDLAAGNFDDIWLILQCS